MSCGRMGYFQCGTLPCLGRVLGRINHFRIRLQSSGSRQCITFPRRLYKPLFVSIGMLLDVGFLFQHTGLIVAISLFVLALKALIACFVTLLLGLPLRIAIFVGLALSQIGEFSFILSKAGIEYGLFTGNTYQLFLNVSVLTMAATPFMIAVAPRLADLVLRLPLPKKLKYGLHPAREIKEPGKKDHLIIIGLG